MESRKKIAVLIGINYFGTNAELAGCHADVECMKLYLRSHGFSQIYVMLDGPKWRQKQGPMTPTAANIVCVLKEAVAQCHEGDLLFVHYSGHGSQVVDASSDEADGWDECICPVDYETAGVITDDVLCDILVKGAAPNVRVRAVFDACHSGSCLDLPVCYTERQVIRSEKLHAGPAVGDNVDAITISGCKDWQTSADSAFDGRPNGALTWALLNSLRAADASTEPKPWTWLCDETRKTLRNNNFSQIPQLSACAASKLTGPVDL